LAQREKPENWPQNVKNDQKIAKNQENRLKMVKNVKKGLKTVCLSK